MGTSYTQFMRELDHMIDDAKREQEDRATQRHSMASVPIWNYGTVNVYVLALGDRGDAEKLVETILSKEQYAK